MKEEQFKEFMALQAQRDTKLQATLAELGAKRFSDFSQEKLLEEVVRKHNGLYKVIPLLLTTAQTQYKQITLKGGVIAFEFYNADGTRNLTGSINVKFNGSQNDPISFGFGDFLVHPFNDLFVSWSAQSGVTCNLLIGYEFDNIFRLQRNTNANIATVSTVTSVTNIAAITGLTAVPSGATEVAGRSLVANGAANPTAIYTVTALKTLYISRATIAANLITNGEVAELRHTDGAGVLVKVILSCLTESTSVAGRESMNFLPPYPIPAGHKLELNVRSIADTSQTACIRIANFWGWEL